MARRLQTIHHKPVSSLTETSLSFFIRTGTGPRSLSRTGTRTGTRTGSRTGSRTGTRTGTRTRTGSRWAQAGLLSGLVLAGHLAFAHGDVTPQAVDTKDLPPLGEQWRAENPCRRNDKAIKLGTSAYNQNCARCHGLKAISGGIAPDLRKLDNDCSPIKDAMKKAACVAEMDDFYVASVRNGAVYMPPFEGILNQGATWAIKAYLETRREKPL